MAFDAVAAALAAMVAEVAGGALAQDNPSCASKLMPCFGYLNATSAPPQSCCDPLKAAAKDELQCLCSLLDDAAILQAFHANITQALQLANLCGAATDPSSCVALHKPGGNTSGEFFV